jgi:preprotein translocase subunit SecG
MKETSNGGSPAENGSRGTENSTDRQTAVLKFLKVSLCLSFTIYRQNETTSYYRLPLYVMLNKYNF